MPCHFWFNIGPLTAQTFWLYLSAWLLLKLCKELNLEAASFAKVRLYGDWAANKLKYVVSDGQAEAHAPRIQRNRLLRLHSEVGHEYVWQVFFTDADAFIADLHLDCGQAWASLIVDEARNSYSRRCWWEVSCVHYHIGDDLVEAAPVQVQTCLVCVQFRAVHIDLDVLLFKNVFTEIDGTVKLIIQIAEAELLRQTSLV